MIKTKEKDKIKCWTQLGRVNVFKVMTEISDPKKSFARRSSKNLNFKQDQET